LELSKQVLANQRVFVSALGPAEIGEKNASRHRKAGSIPAGDVFESYVAFAQQADDTAQKARSDRASTGLAIFTADHCAAISIDRRARVLAPKKGP
jgi:hypothetical protein